MKKVKFLIVIVAFMFGACQNDDDVSSLSLAPSGQTTVSFAADGTTTENATFTVVTNQSTWNIQVNKNWVTFIKNSNSFTLKAKVNDLYTMPEKATVTISAGKATPIVIEVTQAAAIIEPTLSLDHSDPIAFEADGTTTDNTTYAVSTNVGTWQVSSSKEWVQVLKNGDNNTFTVSAVANKLYTSPAPVTITVTAGAAPSVEIAVTQAARDIALDGVEINGVTWAKYNVDMPGTFAESPEDPGKFYQWGRNVAWPATGTVTGWNSSVPGSWGLDPSPSGWRVPTIDEINSLLESDKVSFSWIQVNGVFGRLFTDLNNSNTLFLPAVGRRRYEDGTLDQAGTLGYYESSTANGSGCFVIIVSATANGTAGYIERNFGYSVRSLRTY
jgi:hypothetical protein